MMEARIMPETEMDKLEVLQLQAEKLWRSDASSYADHERDHKRIVAKATVSIAISLKLIEEHLNMIRQKI